MAKHVSVGYQNACEAAKSFENVTTNDTNMLRQAGRISKQIQILCDSLLHPVLKLRKSRLVVGGIKMGGFPRVAKSYVRQLLLDTRNIDRRILFITYCAYELFRRRYKKL